MNSHGDNTESNTPDDSGRHGEGRGRGRHGPDGGDRNREEHRHGDRRRGGRRDGGPDFAGFGHGGPPPWLAGLFDGPGAGRGRGRGRGAPKVRRGDVRSAILDVLRNADEAINGYQVIQQIAERTGDAWRPSPGSVYPTIQQLQDEGLVASDEASGRRTLDLTEAGATYCTEHEDELAAVWAPFDDEADEEAGDPRNLKPAIAQVMSAVWQIASTGTPGQREAAVDILADTRRKLYGVLADGDEA